jgi:hypothetical protein
VISSGGGDLVDESDADWLFRYMHGMTKTFSRPKKFFAMPKNDDDDGDDYPAVALEEPSLCADELKEFGDTFARRLIGRYVEQVSDFLESPFRPKSFRRFLKS